MTVQANAALARKLSTGQDRVVEPSRSILRALRLGLARAAGEGLGLPLSVIGAKQGHRAQAELADRLPDDWLLLLFASGQSGAAAVCLNAGCVGAIVQQQTIGMVTPDTPAERAFTDTDAAMVAPLLEDMMARACRLVDAPEDLASLSGYEYASRPETVRALLLAMADESYQAIDLTVELAGGTRQGEMCILLPNPAAGDQKQSASETPIGRNLEQASGVMRAELCAVLSRVSLPLTSLSGLSVGDQLPLSRAKLDKVEIVTIDRGRMAVGRLGQCGGMRAVRINEDRGMTTLPPTEQQPFLASRSGPVHAQAPEDTGDNLGELTPLGDTKEGSDASPIDAVQIVSEISQLAGLSEMDDQG